MKINVVYCTTCGGIRGWEEVNPTAGASIGTSRIDAPAPNVQNPAVGQPTTNSERYCGCSPQPRRVSR